MVKIGRVSEDLALVAIKRAKSARTAALKSLAMSQCNAAMPIVFQAGKTYRDAVKSLCKAFSSPEDVNAAREALRTLIGMARCIASATA
jgi:hypothetical protein